MELVDIIYTDLAYPVPAKKIYAMQGEKDCRVIAFKTTASGAAWEPPEGYRLEVRYTKPDGTGGAYDTLPDGTSAEAEGFLGYVIAARTVPQMFTVPGAVKVSVAILAGDTEIITFPVVIEVIACPGIDVKSENYENLSPYVKKTGWTGGKLLGTDETGTIVEVEGEAPESSGAKIVSIAVTEAEDGTVTMVNTLEGGGTETLVLTPDESGNPNKLTYNGTEIPISWTEAAQTEGTA